MSWNLISLIWFIFAKSEIRRKIVRYNHADCTVRNPSWPCLTCNAEVTWKSTTCLSESWTSSCPAGKFLGFKPLDMASWFDKSFESYSTRIFWKQTWRDSRELLSFLRCSYSGEPQLARVVVNNRLLAKYLLHLYSCSYTVLYSFPFSNKHRVSG